MHKKRNRIYNDLEDGFEFDETFPGKAKKTHKSNFRRRCRLSVKRRIDDHEEYLWKKRNGWFDDERYAGLDETPSASTVI